MPLLPPPKCGLFFSRLRSENLTKEDKETGHVYILSSLRIEIICNAIKFAIDNHGSEEIQNWGLAAKDHIAANFTLPKMLDQLESYFYSQMTVLHVG